VPATFHEREPEENPRSRAIRGGQLKDDYISTEHLLLGLIDQADTSLKKILQAHGLKRDMVLKALADLRGNQRVTDPAPEGKFQSLEKYGRDSPRWRVRGRLTPSSDATRKSDA